MNRNWRQVRVFTNRFQVDWFHDLLWEVVRPWRQAQPAADYFFSRYISPLNGPEADNADVGLDPLAKILPGNFREQRVLGPQRIEPHHWSVRIRFVDVPASAVAAPTGAAGANPPPPAAVPAAPNYGPVEAALRSVLAVPALQNHFWFSVFDSYELRNDMGGDRFSSIPAADAHGRDARGELVARILQSNCELVMASFTKNGADYQFDINSHGENLVMGTAFQSVGHMVANVWWNNAGGPAGVWAVDARRGIATNI